MASPTRNQLAKMASDPAEFRRQVLLPTDDGRRAYGDVCEPWQEADFQAADPAWLRACGHKVDVKVSRFWLERPRGHSKSSDIALAVTYALLFTRRPLRMIAAACDREQAGLLKDAIERLATANDWIGDKLAVTRGNVSCSRTKSEISIVSSDEASSYGHLVDAVVCDELCHWADAGQGLYQSLFSAVAKRSHALMLNISNAGYTTSWQYQLREKIQREAAWYFHSLDGPQASWIGPEILAEQERLAITRESFARLWLNQWVQGAGDALADSDILAAIRLDGPHDLPKTGFAYLGAVDLGIRRDHSAVVVCGVQLHTGNVHLASVRTWAPSKGHEVDLEEVQSYIGVVNRVYGLNKVLFDPHQAVLMMQQLKSAGVVCEEIPFSGKNLDLMATSLVSSFRNGVVSLFDHPQLLRDLRRLRIEQKSYGYRLVADRTSDGHADSATALAMCLPFANRKYLFPPGPPPVGQRMEVSRPPASRGSTYGGVRNVGRRDRRDGFESAGNARDFFH